MDYQFFLNLSKKKISNELKMGFKKAQRNPYKGKINLDIYSKLKKIINKNQISFLDVGCGDGSISKYLIKKLKIKNFLLNDNKFFLNKIKWCKNEKKISGNFLKVSKKIDKKFNLILSYSVIHYIPKKRLFIFIKKLLKLLSRNGILFLGDVPDKNLILKFLKTKKGKKYHFKYYKNEIDYPKIIKSKKIINHSDLNKFLIKSGDYDIKFTKQSNLLHYANFRKDIIIKKK
tara:strand:+ start:638 stop:1330 length:693 start_codon:yes stop_codon:yes gene_type:complete